LHNIMQEDFGLTINIEDLIKQIDVDDNGNVEFDEFKKFLGGG
jgi:Ca2+-binding EF-hand superfamily protein